MKKVIFLSKNAVSLKMELLHLHVDGTNEGFYTKVSDTTSMIIYLIESRILPTKL